MCIVSFVDMRGLMTCCGKILRIRPSHILAVNCNNLKATHLSDCWKFLSIGPTEIECENDFSNLSQYNYLTDCCIRVTVLLEYFNLLIM